MRNTLLIIFTLLLCNASFANNFYWVGGSGEFNESDNWSATNGGSGGYGIPGTQDEVFIYNYSQSQISIHLSSNVQLKELLIIANPSISFTSNKSISVSDNIVVYGEVNSQCDLILNGQNAKLNFNGGTFNGDVYIKGNIELTGDLNIPNNALTLATGKLISKNQSIICQDFTLKNAFNEFNIENSWLEVKNNLTIQNQSSIIESNNALSVNDIDVADASVIFNESDVQGIVVACGSTTVDVSVTSDYNGSELSCSGANDGEITVTITGPALTPPVYYRLLPGGAAVLSNVFTGLPDQNYVVRVYENGDTSNNAQLCSVPITVTGPFPLFPNVSEFKAATCFDTCNAEVEVTFNGGTSGWEIEFTNTGQIFIAQGDPLLGETQVYSGLCAGTQPYIIRDTNLCEFIGTIDITQPTLIANVFTSVDPTCNGDCDGWIASAPSGGNGSNYSFSWTPDPPTPIGQNTDSISSLCAGSYTVRIEDDSLCNNSFTTTIINPSLLTATIGTITDATCFGVCDGTMEAVAVNGVGPFTYIWLDGANNPIGNTNVIATGLCAGDYRVIITDVNGCFDTSGVGTVGEPIDITSVTSFNQPSCYNVLDGSVGVIAAGGTTPYTYEWFTGGGASLGASQILLGLGAGTFYVVVTDSNSCTDTSAVITLTFPDSITVIINTYDPTCYDLCNGSMGATVSGGTPPYAYLWTPTPINGNGTDSIVDLCPGTYDLAIADANSCFQFTSGTINPVVQYDLTLNSTDLTCNGVDDGTIDVIVNSGADGGPYTVVWAPIPPAGQQGNFSLNGLPAGTWTATIADGNACDTTVAIVITEPITIDITATVNSNATCFADCNGTASTVLVGGQGTILYSWNDPAGTTTANVAGLCAGQYIVTVIDSALCMDRDTITISQPIQISFDTSSTVPTCFNICDATATVSNLAGGTGALTVQWNDPLNQNTLVATGLCGGPIDVTISDQNACDTTITLTIPTPNAIFGPISSNAGACFGSCTGEGYLNISGGIPGFTINWFDATNGVNQGVNNDTITGLCPGQYTATVEDVAGCIFDADTITIIELPDLTISLNTKVDATCGACDGQGDVTIGGGTGPLVVTWNPVPASGPTGITKIDLCEGIYTVTVTDSVGCTRNLTVTINGIANETITMDSTDVSCYNICDGTATATYACLVAPCTITWFDDLGAPIGQTGDVANGLCAGTYTAQLENAGGCFAFQTVTINSPDSIVVTVNTFSNPTCNGICDGEILLDQIGGTGVLTTTWVPAPLAGQGTNFAQGLCAGMQVYTVEDDNGCTFVDSLELFDNPVLDISNFVTTDITCAGANDGEATVSPSGGVPNYTVEWFNCDGTPTGLTGQLAAGLPAGSYYAEVTDAANCVQQTPCDSVRDKTPLVLVIDSNSVSCSGVCDGQLIATMSGGTPNYFYQWLDINLNPIVGETNDTLSNICSGTFSLIVTDVNNCTSTYGPFTLSAPVPWDVTIVSDSANCNGAVDGSGQVIVNAGNTGPYTYLWNPGGAVTPISAPLGAGTYDVTITDASGACDTTVQVIILEPDPLIFNPTISPISCFGVCDGGIDLGNISGGTPTYSILWDGLPGPSSMISLCADTFNIRVSDGNACFKDTTIILVEPAEILANLVANMATCNLCNGSATANPTGGSGGYNYNWNPGAITGQGTQNVTNLCANLYSLIITDNQGCADTTTFIIDNVNADTLTTSSDSTSCFGICDGAAYVSYTCTVPNCSQEWYMNNIFNNIGVVDTTVQNACAGIYFVVVTNGAGCISIDSIRVGEPAEIISNDSITPPTCFNGSDAQIIVTPTGGSGTGYAFNWTPAPGGGQGTNTATGLTPGDWIVDITDSDGCIKTDTITVPNSIEITYTDSATNVTCNGACDGMIFVNASGIAPLTYQWFMNGNPMVGETNPMVFGLCPGDYHLEITDDAGCTITTAPDVTITEPAILVDALDSLRSPLCATDCNGMLDISISGGTTPYTINWFDGAGVLIGQTDTAAINLCAGDYYAEITDSNGCTITTPTYTLVDPPVFDVILTSVPNSCFGTCDGYIVATTTGGTTPYAWTFTDDLNNNLPNVIVDSAFNLCTGIYNVEVTDSNGCTFGPQQVFLQSPSEITANIYSNDATCGLNDGDATVQLITGDPPFTYQWMDATITPIGGETAATISNIGAATYYVEVMDSNGCTEQFQVNVANPTATTLIWDSIIYPTCNGDCDGAIQITATAITPPLSYLWNPGGITVEDPSGLCAGNYSVQLTDAAGCINFYDTTLVDPTLIQTNFNVNAPTCGLCDGDITATVTGGVLPINLFWSNGDTGSFTDSICAGVYDLLVVDGGGCQQIFNSAVSNPNGITDIDASVNPETCFGSCDGSASVNPVGTTGPFTIFWLHDGSNSNNISNLCAGTYFVQVADSNNCLQTDQVIVSSPTEIVAVANIIPPTCGNTDGSITVSSSGGALPHTYSWDSGEITQGITNKGAGVYILTITDANGCTEDVPFALADSDGPIVIVDTASIDCYGNCIGQLNATASNGTPVYTYIWMDFNGTPIGQVDSFAVNLCAGNYAVQVTDAAGCIGFGASVVVDVDSMILSLPVVSDLTCFGICDGQINYIVSGGVQPYTYSWNDPGNSTTLSADSLCVGTYTVDITDANGCMIIDSASVIEPTEIIITTDSITDASCVNSPDGAIYTSVSGGTPGYSYSWTSQDGTFTDTNLIVIGIFPMDYYLEVTDANGCVVYDTSSVDTSLVLIVDAGNDTVICDLSQVLLTGTVTAVGAVTLEWTDSLGNILSDSLSMVDNPAVGITYYVLTATQGVCSISDTIFVTVAAPFTVDAGADIQVLIGNDGVIGGAPTGPDSMVFAWSPNFYLDDSTASNPNVILPQQTTMYTVYVTDTNGCTYSDSVIVEVVPDIIIINGFTPNGDGVNDVWELDFAVYFPDLEVFVYNRWGEELFKSSGYAVPWDGRFKGKDLPVGTYYYIIQLNDVKYPDPFSGPVTIMR